MSQVHEMKTLTLQGEAFDSFRDQQAREDLQKKIPLPNGTARIGQYLRVLTVDEDGRITGMEAVDASAGQSGGISTTAINLLIAILKAGMFTTNVSGKIDSLEAALLAGSSGGDSGDNGASGEDSGDGETVSDDITVSGGIMTIVTVGSEITVSNGIMAIA